MPERTNILVAKQITVFALVHTSMHDSTNFWYSIVHCTAFVKVIVNVSSTLILLVWYLSMNFQDKNHIVCHIEIHDSPLYLRANNALPIKLLID